MKTIQVCPVCGKPSLDLYLGGYLGKMYVCKICGYVGALVVEMDFADYVKMVEDSKSQ